MTSGTAGTDRVGIVDRRQDCFPGHLPDHVLRPRGSRGSDGTWPALFKTVGDARELTP